MSAFALGLLIGTLVGTTAAVVAYLLMAGAGKIHMEQEAYWRGYQVGYHHGSEDLQ